LAHGIPEKQWQPPTPRGKTTPPAAHQVPLLFCEATRDSVTGTIYLKVVNRAAEAQQVHVMISGVKTIASRGQTVTLSASSPDDTNSITEPKKIVPVTEKVDGLSADFTRAFPQYSITVLKLTM
jgi:alpha-N-arabinofuranosidase